MTIVEWETKLLEWISKDIDLVKKHVKKGDTYIDIGANTGLFTKVLIDRLGGDCNFFSNVILFEPIKKYYDECIIKFKNYDNVLVENIGLSDDDNVKVIYASQENYGYNKIYRDGMEIHPHELYEIKPLTFSDWIKGKNYPKIDFIKIDAEGHDTNILFGMLDWFKETNNRPKIMFESNWYGFEENKIINILCDEFQYVKIESDEIAYNETLLINSQDFEVSQDT